MAGKPGQQIGAVLRPPHARIAHPVARDRPRRAGDIDVERFIAPGAAMGLQRCGIVEPAVGPDRPPHHSPEIGAKPVGTALIEDRSDEHTSELQSLMRNSYAVFCFKNKKHTITYT